MYKEGYSSREKIYALQAFIYKAFRASKKVDFNLSVD
jgi:hypothetical protein